MNIAVKIDREGKWFRYAVSVNGKSIEHGYRISMAETVESINAAIRSAVYVNLEAEPC